MTTNQTIALPSDLNFGLSATIIEACTDKIIAATKAVHDEVGSLPLENVSWANTIQKLIDVDDKFAALSSAVTFPMHMSTDADARAASSAASGRIDKLGVELSGRKDVYLRLKKLQDVEGSKLNDLDRRLLTEYLSDYVRQGVLLEGEASANLLQIRTRLTELSVDFQRAMNEDTTKLYFTTAELKGLPDAFVQSLKLVDGKHEVTLAYTELFPILQKCEVASTRQTMEAANSSKCPGNVALIEEAFKLRHKAAQLLGYPNHASFILEKRMAKNTQTVDSFVRDLVQKLEPKLTQERHALLKLKEQDCKAQNIPFDNVLQSYDWRFYQQKRLQSEFSVDNETIKQYFPMERVVHHTLQLYQQLFSVEFVEVPKTDAHHRCWHEDVQQYNVYDATSKDELGTFFLDLYPRTGKYGHAAVFGLVSTRVDNGKRVPAIVAMLANFTKPTAASPSYFYHDEVVTFLHEFGHVVHGLLSQSKYSRFAGTSVERDFVEAPSQMLENWAYDATFLGQMSKHKDTGHPLPADLLAKILNAKNAHSGIHNTRQAFFATIDQICHTAPIGDSGELWRSLWLKMTGIQPTAVGNQFGGFGHLIGGYDSQYYGYLYSEVFSCDMFTSFTNAFDSAAGKRYRDLILAPGYTMDSSESLKKFLNREPNNLAFLKHIGL